MSKSIKINSVEKTFAETLFRSGANLAFCAVVFGGVLGATTASAQTAQDQMHRQQEQHRQQQADDYRNHVLPEQQRQQEHQNGETQSSAAVWPFISVAWHPDAQDVFVATRNTNEASNIRQALAACTQVMGSGCTTAASVREGSIAIARDEHMSLWWGEGSNNGAARRDAVRRCALQSQGCTFFKVFNAHDNLQTGMGTSNIYQPTDLNRLRVRYGALAGIEVKNSSDITDDYWASTGYLSASEAEKAALENCTAASGRKCIIYRSASAGVFGIFRYGPAASVSGGASSASEVRRVLRDYCAQQRLGPCAETAIVDVTGQDAMRGGQFVPQVRLISVQ